MSALRRCVEDPEKTVGRPSADLFSGEHLFFFLFPTMVLSANDRVKSCATLYDQGTEDENGLVFSQRQLGKGLGAFCYEAVTHVYRKSGRQPQKTGLGGIVGR